MARCDEGYRCEVCGRDVDAPAGMYTLTVQLFQNDVGVAPKPVDRLLDLAEVRVAASRLGIKTITIREKDVIFRCERGDTVAEKLKAPATPEPARAVTRRPKRAPRSRPVAVNPSRPPRPRKPPAPPSPSKPAAPKASKRKRGGAAAGSTSDLKNPFAR